MDKKYFSSGRRQGKSSGLLSIVRNNMIEQDKNTKLQEVAILDAVSRLVVIQAKLHRSKFEALIKEGFSEAQAFELCKILDPFKHGE